MDEYRRLKKQIDDWNNHRLQLFEISPPNEALEFFGVMRFYLYDQTEEVQTKCLRISSSATTVDVIEALLTKFWTDLKNLEGPAQNNADRYSLYEVHQNEERRLEPGEYPLYVQLNWTADCRDGRFLLKCNDNKFTRKQTVNDKKKSSKKSSVPASAALTAGSVPSNQTLSQKLYSEKPESLFTRSLIRGETSISNIEGAMRRKREEKVENKLRAFENGDGGPDSGGPLKVYGTRLMPQYHYKSVLAGSEDSAAKVVIEALDKFGISTSDPHLYCLAQVTVPPNRKEADFNFNVQPGAGSNPGWPERFMEDGEKPWQNFISYPVQRGSLMFLLCQRPPELMRHKTAPGMPRNGIPADYPDRRQMPPVQTRTLSLEKPPPQQPIRNRDSVHSNSSQPEVAYLIELPSDNTRDSVLKHDLRAETTDIGSDPSTCVSGGQFLQLHGPGVRPHHCILANSGTTFTLSPSHDAEVAVNGHPISETVILPPGAVIQIGKVYQFQFVMPSMLSQGHIPPAALRAHPPPQNSYEPPPQQPRRATEPPGRLNGSLRSDSASPAIADMPDDSGFDFSRAVDNEETDNYCDDELPAAIEFVDEMERELIRYCVTDLDEVMTMFKIAPSFTIYMAVRYRLSSRYDPSIARRISKIHSLLTNVIREIEHVVRTRGTTACNVAVWMANAAELYHFLHQDKDLFPVTRHHQRMLVEMTKHCSRTFFKTVQNEVEMCFSAFFDTSDRDADIDPMADAELDANKYTHLLNRWLSSEIQGSRGEKPEISHVIEIVSSAWVLLRKCRVNPTLNLQIFGSVLKYIGTFVFNTLLTTPHLCTPVWGTRLTRRLKRLEDWAARFSLEIAAESTLSKVKQAVSLLQFPKKSRIDAEQLSNTCFQLNSLQVQKLLENFGSQSQNSPQAMHRDFLGWMINAARSTVDRRLKDDGKPVVLEEDLAARVAFKMPEDSFAPESVFGLPSALEKFLKPLMDSGKCYISVLPEPDPRWDVYLLPDHVNPEQPAMPAAPPQPPRNSAYFPQQTQSAPHPAAAKGSQSLPRPKKNQSDEERTIAVEIGKINNSLGLSIISHPLDNFPEKAILIKTVIPEGAADRDGRLRAGDRMLEVDGKVLKRQTQNEAAQILTHTGQRVRLVVLPGFAQSNGLERLLLPSKGDTVNRRAQNGGASTAPRPKSSYDPLDESTARAPQPQGYGSLGRNKAKAMQRFEPPLDIEHRDMDPSFEHSATPKNLTYRNPTRPETNIDEPQPRPGSYNSLGRKQRTGPPAYPEDPGAVTGTVQYQMRYPDQRSSQNPPRSYDQHDSRPYEAGPRSNGYDVDRNFEREPRVQSLDVSHNRPNAIPQHLIDSRRQDSNASSVSNSYDPNERNLDNMQPPRGHEVRNERQPNYAGRNEHTVQHSKLDSSAFPAPPPSWHETRASSVQEPFGYNSGPRNDIAPPYQPPPERPVTRGDPPVPHHAQPEPEVAPLRAEGSMPAPGSHIRQVSDDRKPPPVDDTEARIQKNLEKIASLERIPNRTPEEEKKLSRLRLDVEFNRRLNEENQSRLSRNATGAIPGDEVDPELLYARMYSKQAADRVQTDIDEAQRQMQLAEQEYRQRELQKEHERKQREEARLREYEAEMADQRRKMDEWDQNPRGSSQPERSLPPPVSAPPSQPPLESPAVNSNDPNLDYLKEQKERYLQRRREMEEYQMQKEREKEAERQRRVEELRWKKEMEKIEIRKIKQRQGWDKNSESSSSREALDEDGPAPLRPPPPPEAEHSAKSAPPLPPKPRPSNF